MQFKSLEYLQKQNLISSNEGLLDKFRKFLYIEFGNGNLHKGIYNLPAGTPIYKYEWNANIHTDHAVVAAAILAYLNSSNYKESDVNEVIKTREIKVSEKQIKHLDDSLYIAYLDGADSTMKAFGNNSIITKLKNDINVPQSKIVKTTISRCLETDNIKIITEDKTDRKVLIQNVILLIKKLLTKSEYKFLRDLKIIVNDESYLNSMYDSSVKDFIAKTANSVIFYEIENYEVDEDTVTNKFLKELNSLIKYPGYKLAIAGDGDEGLVELIYGPA